MSYPSASLYSTGCFAEDSFKLPCFSLAIFAYCILCRINYYTRHKIKQWHIYWTPDINFKANWFTYIMSTVVSPHWDTKHFYTLQILHPQTTQKTRTVSETTHLSPSHYSLHRGIGWSVLYSVYIAFLVSSVLTRKRSKQRWLCRVRHVEGTKEQWFNCSVFSTLCSFFEESNRGKSSEFVNVYISEFIWLVRCISAPSVDKRWRNPTPMCSFLIPASRFYDLQGELLLWYSKGDVFDV